MECAPERGRARAPGRQILGVKPMETKEKMPVVGIGLSSLEIIDDRQFPCTFNSSANAHESSLAENLCADLTCAKSNLATGHDVPPKHSTFYTFNCHRPWCSHFFSCPAIPDPFSIPN
jgi:hypothetical protein